MAFFIAIFNLILVVFYIMGICIFFLANIFYLIIFPLFCICTTLFKSIVNKKNEFKKKFIENKQEIINYFLLIFITDLIVLLLNYFLTTRFPHIFKLM